MVPTNASITISDGVAENQIFFLQNTEGNVRKQLALAMDEELLIKPFVQDITEKHPLRSKRWVNADVKIRSRGQMFTPRNIFWNLQWKEEIFWRNGAS